MISRLVCGVFVISLLTGAMGNAQQTQKLTDLVVYGEGFCFGVKEPDGWRGDTDKVASKYQVNVVFLPSELSAGNDLTIRVRVNRKVDENTIEDLNYDLQGYRKDYPSAQFSDLNITHAEYKTFARTVFVPDQFYEYVAYLNPGPGRRFVFSVAMSKKKAPATESELNAFGAVLKSLVWLSATGAERQ